MRYIDQFKEIESLKPRKRGFEFEKLINKICEDRGILISGSFRTADTEQQIDGCIDVNSRIFLMEAKWEESDGLAASKLFSFLGKINSKIEGTLGVFISYNRLSDNFVSAVRNGLRQNCILIHGDENISDIISEKVDIKEFIWYSFKIASTKNRIFVNTSEFLSLPSNLKNQSPSILSKWDEISKYLLDSTLPDEFRVKLEGLYEKDIDLSNKVLNIFPVIRDNSLRGEKYQILIKKCINEESDKFKQSLLNKLTGQSWKDFVGYSFLEVVKNVFLIVPEPEKTTIMNIALNHLDEFTGNYEEENKASELIDFLFNYLTEKDFETLANAYLYIYCDETRKEKFLQKKIANQIFAHLKKSGKDIVEIVMPSIINKLQEEKRDEYIFKDEFENKEELKSYTIKHVYAKFKRILANNRSVLEKRYDNL